MEKAARYHFTCPGCYGRGEIDEDQFNGIVSIECRCGYHETKDWSVEGFVSYAVAGVAGRIEGGE